VTGLYYSTTSTKITDTCIAANKCVLLRRHERTDAAGKVAIASNGSILVIAPTPEKLEQFFSYKVYQSLYYGVVMYL